MGKHSFDEQNDEPFEYFKEDKAAKQKENAGLDSLISTIRSDPLLTTDAEPAKKSILERVNLKILVGILFGAFIVILLGYLLVGPGRTMLEHNLAVIVHSTNTPTALPSPTTGVLTTSQPTTTQAPSATPRPTNTPTQVATSTQADDIVEATSTPSSGCREALTITLADVGQTLCVQGIVIETVDNPNAFMVVFSNQPGSFYWVSYDMEWSQAELNTCYQTTGTIQQIANSPILLFDYNNIPEVCP
jgi:hypothetical protein